MTRFALTIEFDGRPYMGWQRQPHGPSVQQAIEEAASKITTEEIVIHGAGRTDAGVHGLGMRAHMDVSKNIEPFRLMEGMNSVLRPQPIAILACEIVDKGLACSILMYRAQISLPYHQSPATSGLTAR